jgi:hypothetical protein
MQAKEISKSNPKSILGGAFLAAGIALMLWTGGLDMQAGSVLERVLTGSFGSLAGLGLVSLQAVQAAAFDHSAFLWLVCRMLVSFSALGMAVAGLALLPRKSA